MEIINDQAVAEQYSTSLSSAGVTVSEGAAIDRPEGDNASFMGSNAGVHTGIASVSDTLQTQVLAFSSSLAQIAVNLSEADSSIAQSSW